MKLFRRNTTPLWRDEFTIDQAEERYVNRRQFAKFLVLTSLGMLAGNIMIAVRRLVGPAPAALPAVPVAAAADIPVGGVRLFSYPGPHDPCILVRLAEARYVAYSQKCTHLSCAVFYDRPTGRLECPCHNGFFDVEDGTVLQGPPPRPLPRIRLEQRGETLVATGVDLAPRRGGHA